MEQDSLLKRINKNAKDIMTHRRDIVAIDDKESLEEALHFILEQTYSRFPVYREDIDEIVGFLHLREAMKCYLAEEDKAKPISAFDGILWPVTVVPETKSIDTLFKEMQEEKNQVVLVLDEYGQTSGIVTMEDILEELVGDIFDEYDIVEKMVTKLVPGKYLANGMVQLNDLQELLGISFDGDDYDTLNGFLVHELDRIPEEGERCVIEYKGWRFTILQVDNNIIERVKIEKLEK